MSSPLPTPAFTTERAGEAPCRCWRFCRRHPLSSLTRTTGCPRQPMANFFASCRPGLVSPNGAAASSPRLRPRRYLGCLAQTSTTPTGLRLGRRTGRNPVGVGGWERSFPQGSSCLATLGWRPQPRWGCQWRLALSLAPGFSRVSSGAERPSRFNGFGGAPLRHEPSGKPLKRLCLHMSPNTRLKPGANERGPMPVFAKVRAVRTAPSVSLSSVRNGGEGWGEEALRNGETVRMGGAPLYPALSPFVPHEARETDALLIPPIPARTLAITPTFLR